MEETITITIEERDEYNLLKNQFNKKVETKVAEENKERAKDKMSIIYCVAFLVTGTIWFSLVLLLMKLNLVRII